MTWQAFARPLRATTVARVLPAAAPVTGDPLADDVRRFVLARVPSVPFLEALLLFRAAPGQALTAETLAARLYVAPAVAAGLLALLLDARLVAAADGGGWVYAPAPGSALAAVVDRLAAAYAADVVGVSRLIHARSGTGAHDFADAFKLRKDR